MKINLGVGLVSVKHNINEEVLKMHVGVLTKAPQR